MTDISLVVLSHGLWGVKGHMEFIEKQINKHYKGAVHVMNAKSNEAKYTYDGIDICGKRLASEVEQRVAALKTKGIKVVKVSFVGYSLGGLIIRFAIGVLGQRGFFDDIEPNYFVTFATPHMGVRLPRTNFQSRLFNYLSGHMVSRTGEQLQLNDVYADSNQPIIYVLSDPKEIYFQYLEKFNHRRTYANTANDRTVPYWTAGLELMDFFQSKKGKLELVTDEKYMSILTSFDLRPKDQKKKKSKESASPWRYVFFAVSPIILPIFLVYAFFYVGIQGLVSRHRVAYLLNRPTIKDTESQETLHAHTGELITDALDAFNLPGEEQGDMSSSDVEQRFTMDSKSNVFTFSQVEPSKALTSESKVLVEDDTTRRIYNNLRKLDWERVWVYLNALNAHGSIVCRQKRFRTDGGVATIQHFIDTTAL